MSSAPEGRTTIVVLPSITFPRAELEKIIAIQHYEERLLCTILMLEDPDLEIVYPSSLPIDEAIIDYYLSFVTDPRSARHRLNLVALSDPEPSSLSQKLLDRPHILEDLRKLIARCASSYVLPFNVTPLETRVAEIIGAPVFGPHHDLVDLGSKSGSRHVARASGVPVLEGAEDLQSMEAVERATLDLMNRRPDAEAVVIKLNNGFSGQGNAIIERSDIRQPLCDAPITFCASEESWASFGPKVEREGAIVEEFVRHPGMVSPSVQMRITWDGLLEVLSTHDQVLGGPDGQVYLGCRFPARSSYRSTIVELASSVGKELLQRGVIGAFGMDFIMVPDKRGNAPDEPGNAADAVSHCFLSEINLRMGGTTHPFLMANLVTGASYDTTSGELVARGRSKCYVATDNLKSGSYVGATPEAAIAAIESAGLAYDSRTATGTLLHLLGALPCFGKVGATCIGDSPAEADELFTGVVSALEGLGAH
ncbi:MAG: hypothetical protein H0U16_09230 [Actinobacteria bacterium]|nr:hypothetical protein [Actinomycetota bacterium]